MSTLMKLLVALGLDTKDYDSKLTDAQKKAQGFGKNLSSIGASMTKAGGAMSVGVTLPLLAAGTAAVDFASNLEESTNKVNVVFGSAAGAVTSFTATASTKLGMSEQAALEAAGTFGNLFTTMGMGGETSAGMSTQLLQLAADMGSFNNMDPTEVLEKLRSGLVGEVEPLRSLGINLTQSAVNAKALEMGLAASTDELTPAMVAQARFALILEQSKNAQGDFARTSEGLANKTRTLKAQLVDAGAKIGTALLPIALKLVTAVQGIITWFTNMSPAGQKVMLVVAAIAAAIGPLLVVLGTLMSAIGGIVTFMSGPVAMAIGAAMAPILPIIGIILGVIAVVVLLYEAWKNNWFGIRDIVNQAVTAVVGFWNGTLLPALQAVAGWVQSNLVPLFQAVGNVLSAVVGLAATVLAGIWQNVLLPAFKAVWDFVSPVLMPLFQRVSDFFTGPFLSAVQSVSTWIGEKLTNAFGWLSDKIGAVVDWLDKLAGKLRNIKLPAWMTPGSPTPWEIGLRGVSDAMSVLYRTNLPRLEAQLSIAPRQATPGYGAGGRAKEQPRGDTNITVYGAADPNQTANLVNMNLKAAFALNGA